MSTRRQQDLLRMGEIWRKLGGDASLGQSDELDPRVVELYDKLAEAGRLDLLEDAFNALLSNADSDKVDPDIDLGGRP